MKNFSLILEAGVNHDGDLRRAFELIASAAETGADYIKFQTYTSEKLAAKHSPSYWDLNEEPVTSQRTLFSKYDKFTVQNYVELAKEATRLGIGFMTTCFDKDWVDRLDHVLPQYKIASADITNYSLLAHVASKGKPIVLSTGASTIEEVHAAVKLIQQVASIKVTLLHCVLNYPTAASDAALNRICRLIEQFPGLEVGYSDHTKPVDSFAAIQSAYVLGARVFEKHFTWGAGVIGNDHYHSFTGADAKKLVSELEKTQVLLQYDDKTFISSQESARLYARRGLYSTRSLEVGEVIQEKDLIPLRPPVGLDGYAGNEIYNLLGKVVTSPINEGDAILRSSFG